MAKTRHKIEKIFYDLHLIGQKYANCIVSVKNSSLIGRQRDWQKDNYNLQKSFLHLTTDSFSLKSGVMLYSRRNFIIRIRNLLAYLEPLHKRFEFFLSNIRCLLFFDLSNSFLRSLQIIFISSHYSLLTFWGNFACLSDIRY